MSEENPVTVTGSNIEPGRSVMKFLCGGFFLAAAILAIVASAQPEATPSPVVQTHRASLP